MMACLSTCIKNLRGLLSVSARTAFLANLSIQEIIDSCSGKKTTWSACRPDENS
jgi:hypothetical protein